MKKILVISFLLFVGCSKKEDIKLSVDCDGDKYNVNGKTSFTCELMDEEYTFSIKTDKNNSYILVDKPGLSEEINNGISLRGEYQVFNLKKGKKLKLVTQTMDYNEDIVIEWR